MGEPKLMVMLSEEDLRRIVGEAVRAELANASQNAAVASEYLTTEEAAALLKCSTRNMLNHVDAGMPHRKIGREYRFRRDEIEGWMGGRGAARSG